MPLHLNFRAASEAAEEALGFLSCAQSLIAKNKLDDARKMLDGVAALWASDLFDAIRDMEEDLARVAEGKIVSHSACGTHYSTSAHAAVEWVCNKVWVCLSHDPRKLFRSDLLEWLGMDVSALRVGVIRERAKLLGQPALSVGLTDDDRYILMVLEAHRGDALTLAHIEKESARMNRKDPQRIKRLSESTIGKRYQVLLSAGLVARPPGTERQGIAITDKGHDALALAAGNLRESYG